MVTLMRQTKIRTYSELATLSTFEERYEYLKLGDKVGEETFGSDRYLNQLLYNSDKWKRVRNKVILRDGGCDLGMRDREIPEGVKVFVHHINPITVEDVLNESDAEHGKQISLKS